VEDAEYTELDRQVARLGDAFAGGIKQLASSPAVQRGLMTAALNDLIWTLYIQFPDDRDLLHEELSLLADAVHSSTEEHQEMARQETPTLAN
jgi:hypothetical protein